MNELIKVNYENDNPTVSARDLYEFLEVGTEFRHWFPRMCEYGFTEIQDYTPVIFDHPQNKQSTVDYALAISMAKEIAMLQRTDKGRQVRQYFLKLEEAWNTPEMVMARAVKLADGKIRRLEEDKSKLEAIIGEQEPLVLFAKSVSASGGSIPVGDMAKLIKQNGVDIGRNRLFEDLRKDGYLCTSGASYNKPTQKAMDMQLLEYDENVISRPDGNIMLKFTPKVTGKGQRYFIERYLSKAN